MADVPISKLVVPGSNDTLHFRDDSAANKVSSSTNGNLAGLDANGNLTDSGVSASSIGNLSGSHSGTCETAAATSAKIVTIGDGTWIPKEGDIIGVKFTYSNTALFVTLNVNGIGNKGIWYGDSVDPSGADYICGKAGSYIFYMYDGTYWIWLNEGKHDGNNFPSVAVYTDSNQQIKIGTCNYYTLTNKSYCHFIFRYPNTYKGELFIKINNSSSKTIYINGEISSSTNYTLPAGTYIAYYENDKWYFRTDGKLTANITGTAASDSTKADKVANATNGNLAGLNGSGNLTNSGWASDKTTTSASGNPISITGLKSNQLAVNPVITFEPIQAGSGDPSPSNVRAISGYDKIEVLSCGFNMLDDTTMVKGGITSTDGSEESDTSGNKWRSAFISVVSQTDYFSKLPDGFGTNIANINYYYYDNNKDFLSYEINKATIPISMPANCVYVRLQFYFSTKQDIFPAKACFNISDVNKNGTWQPYHKTTDLSENLPQTVYGGTLDMKKGNVSVKKNIILPDNDWTYSTFGGKNYIYKTLSDLYSATPRIDPISEMCEFGGYGGAAIFEDGKLYQTADGKTLYIQDSRFLTKEAFLSEYGNCKICYELATPIEIQLTPHEISLLKDYAYVSTNGTSMSFDYHNGEIATLGDVSQLGETVNEIGNGLFKAIKITRSYGNVTSGTRYSYCITDDYPFINNDSIIGLSHKAAGGSQSYDYNGLVNWVDSNNKIYISYVCQLTQNNVSMEIYILYK